MRMTLRKKLVLGAILPVVLLAAIVIIIAATLVRSSLISQVEKSLKGTAVATLAAYEQNAGSYLEASNGDIWKGSYNISQSEKLVDTIAEKSNMDVTFFYGSTRIMTSAKDENEVRILGSPAGDAIVEQVLNQGQDYFSDNVSVDGTTYFGYYVPVYQTDGSDTPIGMVFAGADKNQTLKDALSIIFLLIIIVIIVVCVCVIMIGVLANSVTTALIKSIAMVQTVASGDLNVNVDASSKKRSDEIGDLSRAIDQLHAALGTIVGGISDSTTLLIEESDSLEQTSHETYANISEVQSAVSAITEGANSQADDTKQASEHIQNMGNLIIETGQKADDLSIRADNMLASSDKATETIDELKRISEEVESVVEMIADQTKQTNDSAESIKEASEFISDIAAQTNLLSLNASIEAARAGDAGKGFAVVAQEIQKLAEQSNNASGNIEQTVNTLISNSTRVVDAMQHMQDVIMSQSEHIKSTEYTVNEVMEELHASVEEIRCIENQAKELEHYRSKVVDTISSLAQMAESNAVNTATTSGIINEVSERFRNVEESAVTLRGTADDLVLNVGNFKQS